MHDNYEHYVKSQVRKNTRKLKKVWINEKEAKIIANHFLENVQNPEYGICHGVRNAEEVRYFRNLIGIDIIGTDIAPTVEQFDNTIQWDFHEQKQEWLDHFDFIYSNSFDHAYDPEKCLDVWMSSLRVNGICYIHWGPDHNRAFDAADCFQADKEEYRNLFKRYNILAELTIGKRIVFAIGR